MEKNKCHQNMAQILFPMFFYSSSSILGPLLFFGGIGYLLDKKYHTSPLFLLAGVGLAFIFTNILLFRKLKAIQKMNKDKKNNNQNNKV